MPGKTTSNNQPTGRPMPGTAGQVNRFLKEQHVLPPVVVGGVSFRPTPDGSQAFRFDREPSNRSFPPSVLTAELLRVERTLEDNASEVLDRFNPPLAR